MHIIFYHSFVRFYTPPPLFRLFLLFFLLFCCCGRGDGSLLLRLQILFTGGGAGSWSRFKEEHSAAGWGRRSPADQGSGCAPSAGHVLGDFG